MNCEFEGMEENNSALNNYLPHSYYNDVGIMQGSATYEINEACMSRNFPDAVFYSQNTPCTASSRYQYENYVETMRNGYAMQTPYDSFFSTYYCDVCQVVTESFPVYQNHLRGHKHANMILSNNPGTVMQNVTGFTYPSLFPGHMNKQFPIQGTANLNPSLASKTIEIPELGETYYYSELRTAASFLQSASHLESGSNHQSLEQFAPATYDACKQINHVAEREIDELLKSVIQKHGCRQINSEMKESSENCSYTCSTKAETLKICDTKLKNICSHKRAFSDMKSTVISLDNSKSDTHSSISDDHTSSEISESRKRKRSDSDSVESIPCSIYHSRSTSPESVICIETRKTSERRVSSGKPITERKSKHHKSSKHYKSRKGHSAAHKSHEHKTKRAKKIVETETKSRATLDPNKKYPHPPPGVYRKKTGDVSVIQKIAENLKYPCVGLDKITEIQGLDETHYYCELCDLQSSYRSILAHLESFEHRMKSLKQFAPLIYEDYSKYYKYDIEEKVNKALKLIADMLEVGKITVEKEYLDDDSHFSIRKEKQRKTEYSSNQSRYSLSGRSTTVELIDNSESEFCDSIHSSPSRSNIYSHQNLFHTNYSPMENVSSTSEWDFTCKFQNPYGDQQIMNYRNRSFFDYDRNEMFTPSKFYCNICNSFMGTKKDWEMHITGGRHIINTKKFRGEFPYRRKPVLVPNARAKLMNMLDQIEEPVVGLDMMRETEDPDAPWPVYSCSLCHHNATPLNIIDHILSPKHRLKFLEKIKHPSLHTLKERYLNKYNTDKILRNICAKVEAKGGRGYLSVYIRSAEYEYDYRPPVSKSGIRERKLRKQHSNQFYWKTL